MQTATSKLTKKYQATIPRSVRAALKLRAGDLIAFQIEHDQIQLRKARPLDLEFAKALESTLDEWNSEEDDIAYRDL